MKVSPYSILILAGGLATRLYPMSKTLPKALIEVAGEPFIFHQLRGLQKQGIRDVVLSLGYLGEQIQREVGNGDRWGVSVRYVFDGPTPLGTAGAIRNALPLLDECFFVINGDSYLACDFSAVQAAFSDSGRAGLMTVFKNQNKWDRSNIVFDGKDIQVYDKKNQRSDMDYIDYGLGVLSRKAFSLPETETLSDLADVYAFLLQHQMLAGFEVGERFYEIGSFAGIEELNHHLNRRSGSHTNGICKTVFE